MSITLTPALSLKGEGVSCLVDEPVSQITERPWGNPNGGLRLLARRIVERYMSRTAGWGWPDRVRLAGVAVG